MKPFDFPKGEVLLINKPYRWTSFDAVNKVKGIIRKKLSLSLPEGSPRPKIKVGHAGTLDPLATGLLIICTGKETKNIDLYQAQEKEYTCSLMLGATTPCFDMEKEVDARFPVEHITEALIREKLSLFTGLQQQIPPLFSAIKVDGKRAYKMARAGKSAEIKAREILISEIELTALRLPEIDLRIVCGKGTYIRSLARDLGLALESGAYLTSLSRTRIGSYLLTDALSPEDFQQICFPEAFPPLP